MAVWEELRFISLGSCLAEPALIPRTFSRRTGQRVSISARRFFTLVFFNLSRSVAFGSFGSHASTLYYRGQIPLKEIFARIQQDLARL
jgi:hypothetical protein